MQGGSRTGLVHGSCFGVTGAVRRIDALLLLPCEGSSATLAIEFIVPDRRHRDLDNLIASTKPLTDGIVAAGVLLDDSSDVLVSVTYSVTYVKGESATVYTITPVLVEAAA